MKTTLFGLSAHGADFAMLCVDAPSSVGECSTSPQSVLISVCSVETTREHFSYAITLDVPVFVVINKIDLCSKASIQQTIGCLTYLLKHGSGTTPLEAFVVKEKEDLLQAANMFVEKRLCPIFAVSCLSGENIDLLKQFFNILPPRLTSKEQERLSQLPVEFRVSE